MSCVFFTTKSWVTSTRNDTHVPGWWCRVESKVWAKNQMFNVQFFHNVTEKNCAINQKKEKKQKNIPCPLSGSTVYEKFWSEVLRRSVFFLFLFRSQSPVEVSPESHVDSCLFSSVGCLNLRLARQADIHHTAVVAKSCYFCFAARRSDSASSVLHYSPSRHFGLGTCGAVPVGVDWGELW